MNTNLFKSIFLFGLILFTFVAYQNCGNIQGSMNSLDSTQTSGNGNPNTGNPNTGNPNTGNPNTGNPQQDPHVNPDYCEFGSHPQIRPAGFTRYIRSWDYVYTNVLRSFPFPRGPGNLTPVGAFQVGKEYQTPSAGMYIAIPFTAIADTTVNISFSGAQAIYAANYLPPHRYGDRAGTVFVSISPCAGDFRDENPISPDPFLSRCRGIIHGGVLVFSTNPGTSACKLEAGKKYYWNITHSLDVSDSFARLSANHSSCFRGTCDSNTQVRCSGAGCPSLPPVQ